MKSLKSQELSKEEVIKGLRENITTALNACYKNNYADEDFTNPSWALRQAANGGMIKAYQRILNLLPK
jgi:hypothetical protein